MWIASFFKFIAANLSLTQAVTAISPRYGVFFFRVGKDALNGLRTQRVGFLANVRMPHALRALYVIMPDMCVPSTNTTSGDRYPARATSSRIQRNTPSMTSAVKRWQNA